MTALIAALSDLNRLREIARYDLFHPELREHLDSVSRSSAHRVDQPIGLVTIVLDVAAFLAGSHGVQGWMASAQGTPVEWSFCARVVQSNSSFTVGDAIMEPQYRESPLVTQDGIRSYAGVPLRTESGKLMGAHCVAGPNPRQFTETDLAILKEGAERVMAILENFRIRDDLPSLISQ